MLRLHYIAVSRCSRTYDQNEEASCRRLLLTADDLTEQFLWRVSKEGGTAHQELVQNDAHRPPVNRLPIALTQDHFRGDILRSAAHLEDITRCFCVNIFCEAFRTSRSEDATEGSEE